MHMNSCLCMCFCVCMCVCASVWVCVWERERTPATVFSALDRQGIAEINLENTVTMINYRSGSIWKENSKKLRWILWHLNQMKLERWSLQKAKLKSPPTSRAVKSSHRRIHQKRVKKTKHVPVITKRMTSELQSKGEISSGWGWKNHVAPAAIIA